MSIMCKNCSNTGKDWFGSPCPCSVAFNLVVTPHTPNPHFIKAPMQVKIKKLHADAVIPKYAKPGDAGLDLRAVDNGEGITVFAAKENEWDKETWSEYTEYRTGLAIEIPEGYVGLIFPRSSISHSSLSLSNAVGVIDSGYRGEIRFRFRVLNVHPVLYRKGDKIGQLIIMPYPQVELVESEELSDSERGATGFGSSGA